MKHTKSIFMMSITLSDQREAFTGIDNEVQ